MNRIQAPTTEQPLTLHRNRRAVGVAWRLIACAPLLLLALFVAPAQAQVPSMLDPTVTQIATGKSHTCVLTTAGGVKCWGRNSYGQLGNPTNSGTENANPMPLEVTGLDSGVVAIAAGEAHTCALTTAGAVQCWGLNYHGQLGQPSNNGTTLASPAPLEVTDLGSGVVAIAAGDLHTCALTAAGAVKCWGYNGPGQLGNPTNSGTGTANPTPLDVTNLGSGVAAIATGGYHTCALTTAGAVKCWGRNQDGQLGNPTNSGINIANPTPLDVADLGSGVAAIAAGGYHTCALTAAGAVKCWGLNSSGQLGNPANSGVNIANPTPLDVTNLASGVAVIAAGNSHTCALTTAGAAKCWGSNGFGSLGNANNNYGASPNPAPLDVTGLGSGVAAIEVGSNHTCALTAAGAVKCWGLNRNGQLGNPTHSGSFNINPAPLDVTGFAGGVAYATRTVTIGGNPVAQQIGTVAAGATHTCALTAAGAVKCWGYNYLGQLGNPTNIRTANPNPAPLAVTGLDSGVAAITGGSNHTCALTTAGAVKCWGRNDLGQLGNPTNSGTNNPNAAPLAVTGLDSGVAAIAAGDSHTCALTTAGAVKCWGLNRYGELGNPTNSGTYTRNPAPLDVTNLGSGVVAIAVGYEHTCALITTGAVQCWGWNQLGQLGNPTNSGSSSANPAPLPVTGLSSGVVAIATGGSHSCALTTAGAIQCWGYNRLGQLGSPTNVGSDTPNPAPLAVTGLDSGVAAIGGGRGSEHTCAVTATGAVKCWGYNFYGQLGNPTNIGTPNPNPTPLAVTGLGSGVAGIVVGGGHTCALTTAGALRCWGKNQYGQLGSPINNNVDTGNPVPLALRTGQSLDFNPPAPSVPLTTIAIDGTLPLSASASGGGGSVPIVYEVWTPDTCTVSGATLTAKGAMGALCGVRASRVGGNDGAGGTTATAPQQLRLLQITQATPTLALTSSVNPSVHGQSVSFSVLLGNAATPTGNVVVCADSTSPDASCSGGTLLCSLAANATPLTCASSTLSTSTHSISAWYAGDTNHTSATSPALTQVVNKAATTTTVTTGAPITLGTSVTMSAQVSVFEPGAGTPGGQIDISDGEVACTIVLPATTCSLTPISAGLRSISAAYSGDTNFNGSFGGAGQTVVLPVYTLIYVAGANGTISGVSPQSVQQGASGTPVTAMPNSGYHFVQWSDGVAANPRSDSNVMANLSVSASFAINTYTVSASTGANGAITPSMQTVDHGAAASFTVTPDANHHVVSVTGDTCTLVRGSGNDWSAPNITAACAVTATFAIDTYTVTASAGANGTITPVTQTVDHGAAANFTVSPDANHHVVSVTGDTCTPVQGSGDDWSAPNITAACAVTATFAIDAYTVTATAGANGAITPVTQTVDHGAAANFTVTPEANHHVVSVTGDTCTPVQGGGNDWSAPNITATCAVTATFAIDAYTVTATAGANGTITPATQTVDHGDTASFTVTPASGYHVASVSGDTCDVSLTSGTTWTSDAISADCAVGAVFAIDPADLHLTIDDGRTHARYGQLLNYVVTLKNQGTGPTQAASIAMTLPPQMDGANTRWICLGAGAGAACDPSGIGALQGSVAIPPSRSLTWVVSTPVRFDADGDSAEIAVNARDGAHDVSASDRNTLVVLRSGFDVPDGDGTQGVFEDIAQCAIEPAEAIDDTFLHLIALPPAKATFETLLVARAANGAGFRVERVTLGASQVRLVAVAANGSESASEWATVESGASLALATVASVNGQRTLLLEGAVSPLSVSLPDATSSAWRFRSSTAADSSCH